MEERLGALNTPNEGEEVGICGKCVRLFEEAAYTCSAYPDGIPMVIMVGTVDHRKPYEGDGGQTFIPRETYRKDYPGDYPDTY